MSVNLKDALIKMDDEYGDQMYKMFGPTLLGYPLDCDSSRGYMFTSNLKQVLTLLNPDIPRVQTGFENIIGKYNTAYKKLTGTWTVEDIIYKFSNNKTIYTLILYNKMTDTYDIIEKKVAENLTEKFGYLYNTERMDALSVGDTIKDEILYKSTSYDEHMNYRYGKNAKVYYSTSNDTLEDAVVIRKGWANQVISSEVDEVVVPINDNDIPLNLYGNDDKYQAFPNVGERVINSTLCATRRINKNHLLYDFQPQYMKEINSTDTDFFVTHDSEIYDIDIYYNKSEPFPDNIFYHQLKLYYDDICEYSNKIYQWATDIKESGSKFTNNVTYFRSKHMHFNDSEYKWKNKDKEFSNMLIIFKVKSLIELAPGSKIAGRYGDKGVISRITEPVQTEVYNNILGMMGKESTEEERDKLSKSIAIVDDDKMPYTDDFPVDIILNMSGSIRRLNTGQLVEVELNFVGEELRKRICTLDNDQDKLDIIFRFLEIVNKDECEFYKNYYHSLDKVINKKGININLLDPKGKKDFIRDIETNGFYIVKPPDAMIRYETIATLYDEFSFIKPLPLYINIFGTTKRRIIKDGIVGDKYMIILKQNSNKNFSARSTFRVNRANLPTKDIAKKTNRSSYARSPIRLSEIYNLMSSISGTTLAEWNIFMRSSTLGRKSLDRILETDGNPLELKQLDIKDNFINANADILNAKLKAIGLKIKFVRECDKTEDVLIDAIAPLYIDKYIIYDTPLNKLMYVTLFNEYNKYLSSVTLIETYEGERQDIAWDYVFNLQHIKEMDISTDIKEMLIRTTKGKNTQVFEEDTEIDDEDENTEEDFVETRDEPIERKVYKKK